MIDNLFYFVLFVIQKPIMLAVVMRPIFVFNYCGFY